MYGFDVTFLHSADGDRPACTRLELTCREHGPADRGHGDQDEEPAAGGILWQDEGRGFRLAQLGESGEGKETEGVAEGASRVHQTVISVADRSLSLSLVVHRSPLERFLQG